MTAVHTDDLDLLDRLGGSRAIIHRAVVRTSGRVVVVKRTGWDRPDVAAGLGREAAVLGRVQHPGLVRLLGTVEDDTGRTLVLAHAPGGSLADRLEHHGPLPPAEVADIGARLAEALAALHRAGVVHRDVHPGNVLVDAELRPLLADLDHALDRRGEPLPTDGEVVGHRDHVDPRLFGGHPPGPATDLHALATTLWTLATGSPPARPAPSEAVELPTVPTVPPPLHTAILRCLQASDAADVAMWMQTAALALAPAAGGVSSGTPTTSAPPPGSAPDPTPPPAAPPAAAAAPGTAALRTPGGRGTTQRWGPAPRPPALVAATRAGRRRWLPAVIAVVALALAPAALWWVARGDPAVDTAVAVLPPPPCGDTDPAPEQVLADLDGDGCSETMRLADGVLTTGTGTYRLGEAGDVLVAGDWDGDGAWTPGLYRPATGEAFLFDTAPGPQATSRPVLRLTPGATPQVVDPDGDGRHELVTASADA